MLQCQFLALARVKDKIALYPPVSLWKWLGHFDTSIVNVKVNYLQKIHTAMGKCKPSILLQLC